MHLIGHRKTTTEKLLDQATELAERAAPHVEAARTKLVNEVLPLAQERALEAAALARDTAASARETAAPRAREAMEAARSRAEQHLPHRKKETHKVRNTAVLLGLAGLATWAVKTFSGQRDLPYVPPSADKAPAPVPTSSRHADGGATLAGFSMDSANDAGGADPAEALSDEQAGPHPVTTPDAPAETEPLEPRRP